jgi:hypothetical protein
MALLFGELASQPFYENLLIDRVKVENYDQSDQAENSFGELNLEVRFRALQQSGERERNDSKCEE